MDASDWDARYEGADLVWSAGPNAWVEQIVSPLTPGLALDVAAGEGRHALWLAERGWQVIASDFSPVAVERMAKLADARLGARRSSLAAVVGDATAPAPVSDADLVLLSYLHLEDAPWRAALESAVAALRPGGMLLIIGHARRNLAEGVGGPQDPRLLRDPETVAADLDPLPVEVVSSQMRYRSVATDQGERQALDTVVVARALSQSASRVAATAGTR